MSEHLNPSEAVYGFAAWLTCRKEKTVMSSSDDAAPIADLVKQFCDVNKLPDVSEQWPNNLIHPSGEDVKTLVSEDCNHENIYWLKAVKITERLRSLQLALIDIANIQNQTSGGDWDEIDEAKRIANNALQA